MLLRARTQTLEETVTLLEQAKIQLEAANSELEAFSTSISRELDESEARFRKIFQISPAPMVIIGDRGITEANDAFLQMGGYTQEDLVGKTSLEANLWVNLDDRRRALEIIASQGFVRDFEVTIRQKSGEKGIGVMAITIYKQPDGEIRYLCHILDITTRKQGEIALRESEALYRQAIEAANAVPYHQEYNPETRRFTNFTFMGEGICNLTGYGSDEITIELWESLLEEIIPQGANAGLSLEEALQRSRAGETKVWQADYRIRTREGEVRWISDAAVEIHTDAGIPVGSIGIFQDITMRKRLERELQAERDFVVQIINTMGQRLTVTNEKSEFILVNPAYGKLTGYDPQEILGKPTRELAFPEDENFLLQVRAERRRGNATTYEFRLRHKEGYGIPVLITGVPRTIEGIYAGAIAVITDLTDFKKTELTLRENEARMRQAQHVARLGIWDWEIPTDQTTWWGEMFNIYGIAPETFTGKGQDYIDFTHPEDREQQAQNIQMAFAMATQRNDLPSNPDGTRSNSQVNPQQFRIIQPDGTIRWVEGDAVAVVNQEGEPVRMMGILVDITERKLAETHIRELNIELENRVMERTTQLEAANKELEAFSYSVSHDLRAPLRAISGFSLVLAEEASALLNETHQRYLSLMRDNVQRMTQLIDDLLSFSRLGRQPLRKQTVDLSVLTRDVLDELQSELEGRQVDLIVADLPTCEGDPALLRQVFLNLLSNALKYSRTRPVAKIELGWLRQGDDRVYFVRDNGVGFDMQYADKLFGVFQRLHRQDEFEGTGVGLATIHRIIHRHGGRIWAEAEVDKGATFFFTI